MAPSTASYQQIPTDDMDNFPSSGRLSNVGGRSVDGPAQQRPPQPTEREVRETVAGRRFNPPPPAPYKRALLLASIAFLFWLSLKLGSMGGDQSALSSVAGTLERRGWITPSTDNKASPSRMNADALAEKLKEKYGAEVVHAKRYSNEHKFRPAASPIIKEKLKNGKVRLRGANPGGTF